MAPPGVNAPARGIAGRFRGYLPVAVDVETGGFDAATDALLEIAVVLLGTDDDGRWRIETTHSTHVEPFPDARIDPKALEFNGIIPDHPLRNARPEREALRLVLDPVRKAVRAHGCTRAVLVGHNPAFDLSFLNAASGAPRSSATPSIRSPPAIPQLWAGSRSVRRYWRARCRRRAWSGTLGTPIRPSTTRRRRRSCSAPS